MNKKWTEGFLTVWAMEHMPHITIISMGKAKGYTNPKIVIDGVPMFTYCGTSWEGVARRLKATWPEGRQLDHPPIVLSDEYWDCECELDYINPQQLEVCLICDAHRDDQPQSRVNEIERMFPTSETAIELV